MAIQMRQFNLFEVFPSMNSVPDGTQKNLVNQNAINAGLTG
jgi:hypothetical protein